MSNRGRWWTWIRRVVLAIILILVGRYVARHLDGLRQLELQLAAGPALLAASLAVAWVSVQGLLWREVLRAVGVRMPARRAFAQVWVSNLGKYLPGKFWSATGRIYLSRLSGAGGTRSTVGLAVGNVSFILGGAIFAAVMLPLGGLTDRAELRELWLPILVVVAGGLVVVHPRVWGGAARWVLVRVGRQPVEPRIGYGRSLALVAGYVGSWMVIGVGLCVWSSMLAPITPGLGMRLAGLYVVAWAVSYLSLIAPAGIGIREGIMMAGLSGWVAPEQAVALALGLRVYFVLLDLMAALLAWVAAPDLARQLFAGQRDHRGDPAQ